MAKPKTPESFSGKAITVMRVQDGDGLLSVAVELTLVGGKVTSFDILSAPNLPAAAIGQGSSKLWDYNRSQTIEAK